MSRIRPLFDMIALLGFSIAYLEYVPNQLSNYLSAPIHIGIQISLTALLFIPLLATLIHLYEISSEVERLNSTRVEADGGKVQSNIKSERIDELLTLPSLWGLFGGAVILGIAGLPHPFLGYESGGLLVGSVIGGIVGHLFEYSYLRYRRRMRYNRGSKRETLIEESEEPDQSQHQDELEESEEPNQSQHQDELEESEEPDQSQHQDEIEESEEPDQSQHQDEIAQEWTKLTGIQRDLLIVVAGLEKPTGHEVNREIEKYYGSKLAHGRLYPNLETLVDRGMIEKSQRDRVNNYTLTDHGEEVLRYGIAWRWEQIER